MEDVRKGILSSRSSVSASCIRPRKHNITPENNNEILKYVTKQKQLLLRLLTGDREKPLKPLKLIVSLRKLKLNTAAQNMH